MNRSVLLSSLLHLFSLASLGAQPSLKVCSLLTPAEMAAAGVTLSSRGLFPDDPVTLTRAVEPALPSDVWVAQCTSAYEPALADFPIRFSVMKASKALSRPDWDAVGKALAEDDDPPPGPITEVGEHRCERYTQTASRKGVAAAVLACTVASGPYFLTVEIARSSAAQLPTPAQGAALLSQMKRRLP
jgi:hypothetical protein